MKSIHAISTIAVATFAASTSFAEGTKADIQAANNEYKIAVGEMTDGKYAAACPRLEKFLQLKPKSFGGRINMGNCYQKSGKLLEALTQYRQAQEIANSETNVENQERAAEKVAVLEPYEKAVRAMAEKNHAAACPLLKEMVRLEHGGVRAIITLGECYEASGTLVEAQQAYRQAAQGATPTTDTVLLNLQNDVTAKITALDVQALKLYGLAREEMAQKKFADACPRLQQLIHFAPENVRWKITLGECHEQSGNLGEAQRFYLDAANAATKSADKDLENEAKANIGVLELYRTAFTEMIQHKNLKAACPQLKQLVLRRPENVPWRMMLGNCYEEYGDANAALDTYKQAATRTGDKNLQKEAKAKVALFETYFHVVNELHELKYASACPVLTQQVLGRAPGAVWWLVAHGECYEGYGRYAEAYTIYQQAEREASARKNGRLKNMAIEHMAALQAKQLPREPLPRARNWYGWQTLIGVIGGDAMSVIGVAGGSDVLTYVGMGTRGITGVVVHLSHGNGGRALGSLALNGVPGAGFAMYKGGTGSVSTAGGALVVIGYVMAPIIDLAALSFEQVKPPTQQAKGAELLLPTSLAVIPVVDQHRRGLELMGTF